MESSTSSARNGFLSSPRAQRRMLWFSSAVFAAGLIAFIAGYVLRGSPGPQSPISSKPAQSPQHLVKAPPSKDALKVARQFIETAPLRKNLDKAYDLVGPALKAGITRKEWDAGNTRIIDYPARNTKTTAFLVDWSYKTQMMLEVDLVKRAGAGPQIRPHLGFYLGLERKGGKPNGQWQVTTWIPTWHPPLPMAQ